MCLCYLSHKWHKYGRKREWMRANRNQSLAELCNRKLIRLALIARTPNQLGANSSHHTTWENLKRKTHQTNRFNYRNCTNGQIQRSGSKLIEAGDYTSIETGQACLAARGNHGGDSRPIGNRNGPPRPNVASTPPM